VKRGVPKKVEPKKQEPIGAGLVAEVRAKKIKTKSKANKECRTRRALKGIGPHQDTPRLLKHKPTGTASSGVGVCRNSQGPRKTPVPSIERQKIARKKKSGPG